MGDAIRVRAFGKINLTLAVTGRRADGFHTLRSVMQSISLCDTVTVQRQSGGAVSLTCDDPVLPCDGQNTAYRAAQAFLQAAVPNGGAVLHIEKAIPYQAGLGSASADAAGTLFALNVLFGHPLSLRTLLALASSVGADVPFCLMGGTQLAEGIGEVLSPLTALPGCCILLVKPDEGVSTPEAYRRYDALLSPRQPDAETMLNALRAKDLRTVGSCCENVFEQCCPVADVLRIKTQLLAAGALGSAMSGSGTAVFGLFEEESCARRAAEAISHAGRLVWLTRPATCGVILE